VPLAEYVPESAAEEWRVIRQGLEGWDVEGEGGTLVPERNLTVEGPGLVGGAKPVGGFSYPAESPRGSRSYTGLVGCLR
jgi:hypothetical protein